MAENSKIPKNLNTNKQGVLKNYARNSSPSFDPRKNQAKQRSGVAGNPKAMAKKRLLTEGIKKGAQAYGVPKVATEQLLNSSVGQEALDAAAGAPTIASGATEATKVIVNRTILPTILISSLAPFLIIMIFFLLIFGKDSFGGIGDGTDIYEELRSEIGKTISNYKTRTDIDGTLILATLIGYSDNEELEDSEFVSKNMANMKKQVSKLASYQVMVTKSCDSDSSTIRQIASNDDLIGEGNYNCVPDMEGEIYATSIEEGNYNDDYSGSVYYWNLIDEDFIFNYYNEYMINKEDNTSENDEIISKIISEIYSYYQSLKDESEGADYFSSYITNTGYWWPVGSNETTIENGKTFARGEPSAKTITATFAGNDNVHRGSHGALDISGSSVYASANIIATKGGIVVYPYSSSQTGYGDGYLGCRDGGGYGNYVIIEHGDGIYSLYAHMYANSITVFAGDVVEQGQVIGKMGTSGNSTGPHLHFEIRNGGNASGFKVDPLLYVDPDNPRPADEPIKEWIKRVEGGSIDGEDYIVEDIGDGVLTVGYGIVIVDSTGTQLYTDLYSSPVTVGTRIPIETVDKIYNRFILGVKSSLVNAYAKYGVVLDNNQQDSMISFLYQSGTSHTDAIIKAYADGGNEGYWNYISQHWHSSNDAVFGYGLKLRRAEEYELFVNGDYKYDPLSYSNGSPIKYYDKQSW